MNIIKGNTIQSENKKINDKNLAMKVTIQNKAQDSVRVKSQRITVGVKTRSNARQAGSSLI